MKHSAKRIFLFAFPLLIIGFFSCTGVAGEQGTVNWYSYKDGIEKMQSGEKTGFLYFYTEWCTFCEKMDKETFSMKSISDYLNDNFIPIRVNAEEQRGLAREYGANQYPSNLFLSPDAEVIAGRPGFIPEEQMIGILEYIHTESFETMTFGEFLEER
ncbi:MAG: DUF255 domain-containing protein [Desulfosalsimonadaceae bacterium]